VSDVIEEVRQRVLQFLDQFKTDNLDQKVTQWNMLALRAAIEGELKKLDQLKEKKS